MTTTNNEIVTPETAGVNHLSLPVPLTLFAKKESWGNHNTDKRNGTEVKAATLGTLLRLCQAGTKATKKEQASGWAQGIYLWDQRKIANLRGSVACVGLDIDNEMKIKVDGKDTKVRVPDDKIVTLDGMLDKLNGRECILYTSFRCSEEWPKFRTILPLTRPIGTLAYHGVWLSIVKELGIVADPAAKDISRFWFLSNPDFQVCPNFRVEHRAGRLWDIEPIVREIKRGTSMYIPSDPSLTHGEQPKKVEWATRYACKCPPAISGSGGSAATFNVVCNVVRGFALSEKEALQALDEWNGTCDPPWSEDELLHKIHDAGQSGRTPQWGAKLQKKGKKKAAFLEFTAADYESMTGIHLEGF